MANLPPSSPTQTRSDPIRAKYFSVLEKAEKYSDWLFYIVAGLSILTLCVEKADHPSIFLAANILFATLVVALFVLGLAIRLYFYPRAEDMRRKEFFAKACGVPLTHETTVGYYNNNFTEPIKRIAAQVLENSFFSKNIALKMLHRERTMYLAYAMIFVAAVFYRSAEITFIIAGAQALFSEQIIARLLRLEWARSRFETTFNNMYSLFQTGPPKAMFFAHALEIHTTYETTKSSAGITLSSTIFEENNADWSAQWEVIKTALKI